MKYDCPINPDCAAHLARLDERSKFSAETLDRVEKKVDDVSDRLWGLKLKVVLIATTSSGVLVGAAKLLGMIVS